MSRPRLEVPRLAIPNDLEAELQLFTPRTPRIPHGSRTPRPISPSLLGSPSGSLGPHVGNANAFPLPPTVEECLELIDYQQDLLEEYAYEVLKLNIMFLKHTQRMEGLLARWELIKQSVPVSEEI